MRLPSNTHQYFAKLESTRFVFDWEHWDAGQIKQDLQDETEQSKTVKKIESASGGSGGVGLIETTERVTKTEAELEAEASARHDELRSMIGTVNEQFGEGNPQIWNKLCAAIQLAVLSDDETLPEANYDELLSETEQNLITSLKTAEAFDRDKNVTPDIETDVERGLDENEFANYVRYLQGILRALLSNEANAFLDQGYSESQEQKALEIASWCPQAAEMLGTLPEIPEGTEPVQAEMLYAQHLEKVENRARLYLTLEQKAQFFAENDSFWEAGFRAKHYEKTLADIRSVQEQVLRPDLDTKIDDAVVITTFRGWEGDNNPEHSWDLAGGDQIVGDRISIVEFLCRMTGDSGMVAKGFPGQNFSPEADGQIILLEGNDAFEALQQNQEQITNLQTFLTALEQHAELRGPEEKIHFYKASQYLAVGDVRSAIGEVQDILTEGDDFDTKFKGHSLNPRNVDDIATNEDNALFHALRALQNTKAAGEVARKQLGTQEGLSEMSETEAQRSLYGRELGDSEKVIEINPLEASDKPEEQRAILEKQIALLYPDAPELTDQDYTDLMLMYTGVSNEEEQERLDAVMEKLGAMNEDLKGPYYKVVERIATLESDPEVRALAEKRYQETLDLLSQPGPDGQLMPEYLALLDVDKGQAIQELVSAIALEKAVDGFITQYGEQYGNTYSLGELWHAYDDMKGIHSSWEDINWSDETVRMTKEMAIMVSSMIATSVVAPFVLATIGGVVARVGFYGTQFATKIARSDKAIQAGRLYRAGDKTGQFIAQVGTRGIAAGQQGGRVARSANFLANSGLEAAKFTAVESLIQGIAGREDWEGAVTQSMTERFGHHFEMFVTLGLGGKGVAWALPKIAPYTPFKALWQEGAKLSPAQMKFRQAIEMGSGVATDAFLLTALDYFAHGNEDVLQTLVQNGLMSAIFRGMHTRINDGRAERVLKKMFSEEGYPRFWRILSPSLKSAEAAPQQMTMEQMLPKIKAFRPDTWRTIVEKGVFVDKSGNRWTRNRETNTWQTGNAAKANPARSPERTQRQERPNLSSEIKAAQPGQRIQLLNNKELIITQKSSDGKMLEVKIPQEGLPHRVRNMKPGEERSYSHENGHTTKVECISAEGGMVTFRITNSEANIHLGLKKAFDSWPGKIKPARTRETTSSRREKAALERGGQVEVNQNHINAAAENPRPGDVIRFQDGSRWEVTGFKTEGGINKIVLKEQSSMTNMVQNYTLAEYHGKVLGRQTEISQLKLVARRSSAPNSSEVLTNANKPVEQKINEVEGVIGRELTPGEKALYRETHGTNGPSVFEMKTQQLLQRAQLFRDGFSAQQRSQLEQAGLQPRQVRNWMKEGLSEAQTTTLRDAGFSKKDIAEMQKGGFSQQHIRQLVEAGYLGNPSRTRDMAVPEATVKREVDRSMQTAIRTGRYTDVLGGQIYTYNKRTGEWKTVGSNRIVGSQQIRRLIDAQVRDALPRVQREGQALQNISRNVDGSGGRWVNQRVNNRAGREGEGLVQREVVANKMESLIPGQIIVSRSGTVREVVSRSGDQVTVQTYRRNRNGELEINREQINLNTKANRGEQYEWVQNVRSGERAQNRLRELNQEYQYQQQIKQAENAVENFDFRVGDQFTIRDGSMSGRNELTVTILGQAEGGMMRLRYEINGSRAKPVETEMRMAEFQRGMQRDARAGQVLRVEPGPTTNRLQQTVSGKEAVNQGLQDGVRVGYVLQHSYNGYHYTYSVSGVNAKGKLIIVTQQTTPRGKTTESVSEKSQAAADRFFRRKASIRNETVVLRQPNQVREVQSSETVSAATPPRETVAERQSSGRAEASPQSGLVQVQSGRMGAGGAGERTATTARQTQMAMDQMQAKLKNEVGPGGWKKVAVEGLYTDKSGTTWKLDRVTKVWHAESAATVPSGAVGSEVAAGLGSRKPLRLLENPHQRAIVRSEVEQIKVERPDIAEAVNRSTALIIPLNSASVGNARHDFTQWLAKAASVSGITVAAALQMFATKAADASGLDEQTILAETLEAYEQQVSEDTSAEREEKFPVTMTEAAVVTHLADSFKNNPAAVQNLLNQFVDNNGGYTKAANGGWRQANPLLRQAVMSQPPAEGGFLEAIIDDPAPYRKTVEYVQRSCGLTGENIDGYCGPITLRALSELTGREGEVPEPEPVVDKPRRPAVVPERETNTPQPTWTGDADKQREKEERWETWERHGLGAKLDELNIGEAGKEQIRARAEANVEAGRPGDWVPSATEFDLQRAQQRPKEIVEQQQTAPLTPNLLRIPERDYDTSGSPEAFKTALFKNSGDKRKVDQQKNQLKLMDENNVVWRSLSPDGEWRLYTLVAGETKIDAAANAANVLKKQARSSRDIGELANQVASEGSKKYGRTTYHLVSVSAGELIA